MRLRLRIQRPKVSNGTISTGTATSTSAESLRLVTNINASAPTSVTAFLSAMDALEPITVWISVVSAVSRDNTSPVRVISKKAGVSSST